MDVLACPACGGVLTPAERTWTCVGCNAAYQALRGIPDLRTAEDVYLPNAVDRALALRLDESYDRLDFRGLLDLYYDLCPEVAPDRRARQIAHILSAPGRARQWIDALGLDPEEADPAPLLDLGCGPGGFLAASAADSRLVGRTLWGLDIALRWLILARKRLDEAGLGRVRLVCACAERLPLRDRAFAGIVAGDAIEHVADQAATLAESHRVLRPGGRAVLATPNRFSLAPEPHVGLWGVGFLPRPLMRPYAAGVRKRDFNAILARHSGGWAAVLRRSPFGRGIVHAPPLPSEDLLHFGRLKRTVGRAYNCVVSTVPGQAVARSLGPILHLVVEKSEERTTGPATLRRSSKPAAPR